MNRRAFLASIPLIPVAVKAAVTKPSIEEIVDRMVHGAICFELSKGVVAYHEKYGLETDLDGVFKRIYATRNNRPGPPPQILFTGTEAEADEVLKAMKRIYGTHRTNHRSTR